MNQLRLPHTTQPGAGITTRGDKVHFCAPRDPSHTWCGQQVLLETKQGLTELRVGKPYQVTCLNCITLYYEGAKRP